MRKLAIAAAMALIAGTAVAESNDARWKRLEARAADYGARTWVRLRDRANPDRSVWVDAASAGKLKRRNGRPRTVLVLWLQDPETAIAHVGQGVHWTIAETTVHCRDRSATEHRWHFGPEGRLMAETAPVREEVAADDLLYDVICEGADVRESARKQSALGVANYEAAGQTDGPAAPG